MKIARWYIAGGILMLAAAFALSLWPTMSPWESFGVDTVTPTHVHPGGTVTVARNFRISRSEVLTVTRAMVRGDCRKKCDYADLSGGTFAVEEGIYVDNRRSHKIPDDIAPGIWILRFAIQWDAPLWGMQKASLPPLTLTVDPAP